MSYNVNFLFYAILDRFHICVLGVFGFAQWQRAVVYFSPSITSKKRVHNNFRLCHLWCSSCGCGHLMCVRTPLDCAFSKLRRTCTENVLSSFFLLVLRCCALVLFFRWVGILCVWSHMLHWTSYINQLIHVSIYILARSFFSIASK